MTKETNESNEVIESQENIEAAVEAVEGEMAEEASADETGPDSNSDKPSYDELVLALQQTQAKAEESREQALRVQAELENTRRRAERDVQGAHKFALEKFVNELLPVKDSLEMGGAAAKVENNDLAKVSEGIELTVKMMTDVMAKFGVAEVDPVGQPFDPELHQAMSMQDVPDAEPNTVITVFQKGYQLNERLVRPAMVVVAGAKSGGQPSSENSIDEMA